MEQQKITIERNIERKQKAKRKKSRMKTEKEEGDKHRTMRSKNWSKCMIKQRRKK